MSEKRKHGKDFPRCTVCRKRLPEGANGGKHFECRIAIRETAELSAIPIPPEGADHAEIAKALGVTSERVRQIEKRALEKLGRICRLWGVDPKVVLGS